MDPVTHGISGALLGKGFFSNRQRSQVAIFAAILGAIAPDVDVFAGLFTRDPLSIIKYHRALTHSWAFLPFFAMVMAWLTPHGLHLLQRRYEGLRGLESPSFGMLTLIYGVGIASHILLDGMTSFGTRMWFPFSNTRVAWDLLFIVDFTFATVLLVPQVIPWIYRDPHRSRSRALNMWVLFTAGAFAFWALAWLARYPFHLRSAVIASAVLAVCFFAPAAGGLGARVTRAEWCQWGTVAAIAYLFFCSVAHHRAMLRVKTFADQNRITVNRIGALPIPPSLLDWGDAIRSPNGIYADQFDLRNPAPPDFHFIPDSPPDLFIARAFQLPQVHLYWQFVRFPSILSFTRDGQHIVELGENRFYNQRQRSPQPFTYQVIFDARGKLLAQGWLTNGMMRERMETDPPHANGGGQVDTNP
jgi:membrane-bound metal-dependent hydrolase YbcI (DUF457 family)